MGTERVAPWKSLWTHKSATSFGGSTLSHALYSLSNFLLLLLGARTLATTDFGVLSIRYAGLSIALGLGRACIAEGLIVRTAGLTGEDVDLRETAYGPAAIAVGAAMSIFALCLEIVVAEIHFLDSLLVWSAVPGILVLDMFRHRAFARLETRYAVSADSSWLVLQTIGYAAAFRLTQPDSTALLSMWAWSGAIVGGAVWIRSRMQLGRSTPSGFLSDLKRWILQEARVLAPLGLEYAAGAGAAHAIVLALSFLLTSEQVGAVRGVWLLFAPVNVFYLAVVSIGVTVFRRRESAGASYAQLAWRASSVHLSITAFWIVVVLWLLPGLGGFLLGQTWPNAIDLAPPYAAHAFVGALSVGPVIAIRAASKLTLLAKVRVASGPFMIAAAVAGAALSGTRGVVIAMAAINALTAAAWWLVLGSTTNSHVQGAG